MRLGYNTNGLAFHDWPDALELVAETGYRSVAITVDHHCLNPFSSGLDDELSKMRETLARLGLSSVIETGARFLLNPRIKHEPTLLSPTAEQRAVRVDFLKRSIDIARALGSDAVSFWSGVLRESISRPDAMQRLAEGCREVVEYATHENTRLAFEPEPGMFIESFADFTELLEHIDAPIFGLTVDIGHVQCVEDGPIAEYLREWSDRLFNVHIEDMVKNVHEHLRFGDGDIDFPPVLAALKEIGYTGGVHVELSRHSHMAPEVLRESFEFLSAIVEKKETPRNRERDEEHTMSRYAVLLSIPGLRATDLAEMPRLSGLGDGATTTLTPSFPCMTCPVQVSLTTGVGPETHGVIANGFYWRDMGRAEMWTAWNEVIEAPQIWDTLAEHDAELTSAVWFPLLSKGTGAKYVCTFAPIHNPDGSESLWCYTKPTELYGELRDALGHFPLKHFWGPLAGIPSTDWIVDSAIIAAERFQPRFSYIYLPHLDYAAQKFGPDSDEAKTAIADLDAAIGRLIDGVAAAGMGDVLWLAAGEYAITPVDGVCYPNRILRDAELLKLREEDGRELLVPGESRAWALADHQLAHVYVKDSADVEQVAELFRNDPDVAEVLVGDQRSRVGLNHPRSGEVVLISDPAKWFAYYWWTDDEKAPAFARTVDIHNKPGYDPVEMYFDRATMSTPLDASLVKGTHGYPADSAERQSVLLSSNAATISEYRDGMRDVDVAGIVLRNFGVG